MTIEALPEYITIVLQENAQFRWFVYEKDVVVKHGDVYDKYSTAFSNGQYWLRTEIGEGRL